MDRATLTILAPICVLLLSLLVSCTRWRFRSRGRPLPPGPTGLPILGNIAEVRKTELWKVYRDLCARYGEIVHLNALGQHIVVLGSPRVIFDLLEKHSANTSDRMQSVLVSLSGQEGSITVLRYGLWWRRHRRAFWQHFVPTTIPKYFAAQRDASHLFLQKLLADPSQLCEHIRYTFADAVVKVLYGVQVAQKGDRFVALMDKALESGQAFIPGTYLVELLPFLRHIPEWIPGGGFQRDFAEWRNAAYEVRDSLADRTREEMIKGSNVPSVVSRLLEGLSDVDDASPHSEVDVIKNVAFTGFEGGADTTFASLQAFFIAMYLYPEVQDKAQAELNTIVGPDRLPNHSDRDNLPYINALIKELMRWHPVLPFAFPHSTTEDMEYEGYFIPAGTIIMPNTWACLHDPEIYPEPERFDPERFLREGRLDTSDSDPARYAFGFGRRICPGRYYADASLFINITMVLHSFDITPPLDEHGNAVLIEPRMSDRIVAYPEECRCTIKPRSGKAKDLILGTEY